MLAPRHHQSQTDVGVRLLEAYISLYLMDTPDHISTQDKKALRLSCKRLKGVFDASITSAGFGDSSFSLNSSPWNFIRFSSYRSTEEFPDFCKSLDLLSKTFPSLKSISSPNALWTCYDEVGLPESVATLPSFHRAQAFPDNLFRG